jgi:hypothetical protein
MTGMTRTRMNKQGQARITFYPEPGPRERRDTVISGSTSMPSSPPTGAKRRPRFDPPSSRSGYLRADRLAARLSRPPRSLGALQDLTATWANVDMPMTDLFLNSVHFCAIEASTSFAVLDRIGVDRVMVELDYPHVDSTWPDVQPVLARQLAGLPQENNGKVTYENVAKLVKHPVP